MNFYHSGLPCRVSSLDRIQQLPGTYPAPGQYSGSLYPLGKPLYILLSLQVALDVSQYHAMAVRRVLSTESDVVSKFGVTDFPSCYLLFRNGSVSRVPV